MNRIASILFLFSLRNLAMKNLLIALACACVFVTATMGQETGSNEPAKDIEFSRRKVLDLVENRLEKKEIRKLLTSLAVTVTQHAHPSGNNPDLIGFRFANHRPGVVQLIMNVEYFGAITGRRYPATIYLTLDRSDPSEMLITQLDFVEGANRISPNRQNVSLLKRKLNQKLAE
jgi:hypothetical protein